MWKFLFKCGIVLGILVVVVLGYFHFSMYRSAERAQGMKSSLTVGMTKEEVEDLMGPPSIRSGPIPPVPPSGADRFYFWVYPPYEFFWNPLDYMLRGFLADPSGSVRVAFDDDELLQTVTITP